MTALLSLTTWGHQHITRKQVWPALGRRFYLRACASRKIPGLGFGTEPGSASLRLPSANYPDQSPTPLECHSWRLVSDTSCHPLAYRWPPLLVPRRCKVFTLWSSSHCCRSSSVSNEIPSSPSSRLPEGYVAASQSIQPQLIPSGDR